MGIVLAAIFLSGETIAKYMGVNTYSLGYIAASVSFLGAILLGARRS